MARKETDRPIRRTTVRYTNVNVKKVNNGYVISAHDETYSKEKEMIAANKQEAQIIANKLLKIK